MTSLPSLDRRAFLIGSSLILVSNSSKSIASSPDFTNDNDAPSKIGLITDLHYADKAPGGTRHYRESLDKLAAAASEFSKQSIDFVVELGDLIDSADTIENELKHLKTINQAFSKICEHRHYVLGNHCVHTLTKQEFLSVIGKKKSWYSFDHADFHYVVLDSCFLADGTPYGRKNFEWTDPNIPESELKWLKEDLAATKTKTIIFAHQRLDVSNDHGVNNAPAVREILESSGNVLAVFQGHSHANDYKQIAGIHYCTLVAMVEGSGAENNGYSVMTVAPNGDIKIDGFVKQQTRNWDTSDLSR